MLFFLASFLIAHGRECTDDEFLTMFQEPKEAINAGGDCGEYVTFLNNVKEYYRRYDADELADGEYFKTSDYDDIIFCKCFLKLDDTTMTQLYGQCSDALHESNTDTFATTIKEKSCRNYALGRNSFV